MNKIRNVLIVFFLLQGCASIGNQVRIMPVPDENWKYSWENYGRDDMTEYDCPDFKIRVWNVLVKDRAYFIGPLLPIIPVFLGVDESKDNPKLNIDIQVFDKSETAGMDLSNPEWIYQILRLLMIS